MIKITHIISDSNIGGAGRYLLTYLNNCDKEQFDVSVVVPKDSLLIEKIKELGFNYYEVDGMAETSYSKEVTKELITVLRKIKPDIVHTHASLSGRIAARLTGVKRICYTRHSVFPVDKKFKNPINRFLNKIADKFLSSGIIAVAEAAKQNVVDTGIDGDKIKVIYNGIDKPVVLSQEEKEQYKEELGIPKDKKVVSIIARLTEVKGHKYFIDAAETAMLKGLNAVFVIAGTGEEYDSLVAYAKEKMLDDYVIFTGFLKDIYKLENITDVQVNASFGTEAASLSLLEGMSLGIPAVVSDFGGNPELITSEVNGYVVPQKSSQYIAEQVIRLLSDDKLYSDISLCCEKVFNDRFTSKIMTKNMEQYYMDLLKK
ncbi:MAG: glycosyltransferase [Clostridia bacterium]|nr:glycosyltransferase [Clostridia bacterium]